MGVQIVLLHPPPRGDGPGELRDLRPAARLHARGDLVAALGLSGSIPVVLAAWVPVAISIMTGMALMLHLEDG